MNDFKRDMAHIQELVGNSFTATGGLVALADGGQMTPAKLRKTLEQAVGCFESATVELRQLCERYMPPAGYPGEKPTIPQREVTGSVELIDYHWLHIRINTLLPSAAYQVPVWLSDTIRRLLDEYEAGGRELPYYEHALMVIDERSDMAIPDYRQALSRAALKGQFTAAPSDVPAWDAIYEGKPFVVAADMDLNRIDGAIRTAQERNLMPISMIALKPQFDTVLRKRYREKGLARVFTLKEDMLRELGVSQLFVPSSDAYKTEKGEVINAPLIQAARKAGGSGNR